MSAMSSKTKVAFWVSLTCYLRHVQDALPLVAEALPVASEAMEDADVAVRQVILSRHRGRFDSDRSVVQRV